MSRRQAVIALGSNLSRLPLDSHVLAHDECAATISAAAERIAALPNTELLALSSIYTSKPAEFLDQPDFKNAVLLAETELEPWELLHALQDIEAEFGRVREGEAYVPYGPRTLDLDIIDIEGIVLDDPELTLPHPKALQRDFVVTPLLEISPHHVLANQKVVTTALVDCGEVTHGNGEADSLGGPGCLASGLGGSDTNELQASESSRGATRGPKTETSSRGRRVSQLPRLQ